MNITENKALKSLIGFESLVFVIVEYPLNVIENMHNNYKNIDFSFLNSIKINGVSLSLSFNLELFVFESDELQLADKIQKINESCKILNNYKLVVSKPCYTSFEFQEELSLMRNFCNTYMFYVENQEVVYDYRKQCNDENKCLELITKLNIPENREAYCRIIQDILLEIENNKPSIQNLMSYINVICRVIQNMLHSLDKIDEENNFIKWQKCRSFNELKDCILSALNQLNEITYSKRVMNIIAYLKDNLSDVDVIDNMAIHFNNNKEYLSKVCKKETGMSLLQLLNEIRMEQAKYYLTHNDYKIYEVAEKCGFTSSQYFAVVFYKKYHKTPSEVAQSYEKI